jgi:hypothetical protein
VLHKHIDVKYHHAREIVKEGIIQVGEVRIDDQLGDILTKALGKLKFQEMRSRIGMVDVNALRASLRRRMLGIIMAWCACVRLHLLSG